MIASSPTESKEVEDNCDLNSIVNNSSQLLMILNIQKLAFDGFMRTEILNDLSNQSLKIMTDDITTLCSKFYVLDIISLRDEQYTQLLEDETDDNSWMKNDINKTKAEIFTLWNLSAEFHNNQDWFIACKVLRICIKHTDQDKQYLALSHSILGSMIFAWNACTKNDKEIINEAAKEYEAAVALTPKDDSCRYDYGDFLEDCGRFNSAKNQFLKAIELNPSNKDAMIRVGYCYSALDDDENAYGYFKQAIEIDPDDPNPYIDFADYCYENLKDYEQAKKYLEQAIELKPDNCKAYHTMAVMIRDCVKDYQESEKYYMKCYELNPSYPAINSSYGYLLYLTGDYDKAMEYVEIEFKDGDTTNYWLYFYYGLINLTMDNVDVANEYVKKAVEFTRTYPQYRDVLLSVPVKKDNDNLNKEFYDTYLELVCTKFNGC